VARIQGKWADAYRQKWIWDKVSWGGHSVDCYPGGCPWRVYSRDGKILREEQAAVLPPIEESIPDMNPMGCQKGASWSHCHYSPDRVTQPLKRVGERGKGKFKPVSWDEALTDIADAIVDAIREQGAESVLTLLTPEPGAAPARLFTQLLGTPMTDGNAEFHDFSPGYHITWGLFNPVSTMDDWFLAELTLIWHANPVYTNIHWYHYVAESRYNGGEVVTIAPDYSPSAIHAEVHLPVRIGTDAALALSMCKVIIDAGLYNKQFVQEQTDMPLLVRKDTGRFLRGNEVNELDREDQFFWWDALTGAPAPAPRHTLATTGVDPALEGSYKVTLADGTEVEVEPVFERLKRHLENYTPEKAATICEVHPDNIRKLARKVATRKTKIFIGWNSGKYTHGGVVRDEEARMDEMVRDLTVYGVLPKGTTLETLRQKGAVRFVGWGMVGHGISQASTIRPNEVHNPLRWHTEDKVPYDTLVRRAQFYIDHEWFLEAGEELPTHKEPPPQGGRNRRFLMTSGHNRWSIHSMNMTNNIILNTHRGEPFVFINDQDAASLGVANGEKVKMVNDVGEIIIQAKVTPSCRPGQLIVYNGFEPYMHEGWYSQADIEPGPVKHLGFVGNYGHLKYRMFSWQPVPVDRPVRVDVQKIA